MVGAVVVTQDHLSVCPSAGRPELTLKKYPWAAVLVRNERSRCLKEARLASIY